jgi:hypothetical protein
MTKVEKAQAVLADLQAKREALIARGHELDERRQEVAFAAHTGSKAERAKLDEVNSESITFEYDLKALDAAIAEATKRLAAADAAEAQAKERDDARKLREVVDRFVAHAVAVDKAFQTIVRQTNSLEKVLREIHILGCPFPSSAQLDSLGARALGTAIMQTPFRKAFEHLAPSERQHFPQLVRQWADRVEHNFIKPRLGEREDAA